MRQRLLPVLKAGVSGAELVDEWTRSTRSVSGARASVRREPRTSLRRGLQEV